MLTTYIYGHLLIIMYILLLYSHVTGKLLALHAQADQLLAADCCPNDDLVMPLTTS